MCFQREIKEILEIRGDPGSLEGLEDADVEFQKVATVEDILSGDSVGEILGKLKKWYGWISGIADTVTDLKFPRIISEETVPLITVFPDITNDT